MSDVSWVFILAVFVVAALYASVGHGGASGYLAVLSFGSFSSVAMASSALVLNLLVAGTAWVVFQRARYFSLKLLAPFCLASIPAAFLGGVLSVPSQIYAGLLMAVLLFAAWRLWVQSVGDPETRLQLPHWKVAIPIGAGIGLLSGVVGVGGGIFLSPVLLLLGWANAKETAAVSAAFILVNSLAGIGGRLASGHFQPDLVLALAGTAFVGGLLGSLMGAWKFPSPVLRKLLSVVLCLAVVKLGVRWLG